MRNYTLDAEIHHLMEENLERAGKWLFRKTQQCTARKQNALEELKKCHQDAETLVEQWRLQIATQTQPLPSES